MKGFEVVLGARGQRWTARYGNRYWENGDLSELQKQVGEFFARRCPERPLRVDFRFDMKDIPRWFHQYQQHYFNEYILIEKS